MITEHVQDALEAVITNTYPSIGDEQIETPFCIHEEREEAIHAKEGISGYRWAVEVAIVDDLPDSVETYAAQAKTAIEALEGTATGSVIGAVFYEGSDPGFDQQTREYARIMRFTIMTQNR